MRRMKHLYLLFILLATNWLGLRAETITVGGTVRNYIVNGKK